MASQNTNADRLSAAATSQPSTSSDERVVWYYRDENTSDGAWIPFGDINNQIVEDAFRQRMKKVELDHCLVDFDQSVQIDKEHPSIRQAIKRSHRRPDDVPLRSERFHVSQKLVQSSNESDAHDRRLVYAWGKRHKTTSANELLESAADGIIREGALLGLQGEAQWIAQELRALKGKSNGDIDACVIGLYTKESFLYRLVNKALRENDPSKVQTLGPFIRLLYLTDCSPSPGKTGYAGELYRGAELDQRTIDSYRQCIGQKKTYDAFSSTSKNRKKAESYGNVLFVLNRDPSAKYKFSGMDISALSEYPDEEEVLVRAARNFIVQDVRQDEQTGKYLIYLLLQ